MFTLEKDGGSEKRIRHFFFPFSGECAECLGSESVLQKCLLLGTAVNLHSLKYESLLKVSFKNCFDYLSAFTSFIISFC